MQYFMVSGSEWRVMTCVDFDVILFLQRPRSEAGDESSVGGTIRSRLLYLDVS